MIEAISAFTIYLHVNAKAVNVLRNQKEIRQLLEKWVPVFAENVVRPTVLEIVADVIGCSKSGVLKFRFMAFIHHQRLNNWSQILYTKFII